MLRPDTVNPKASQNSVPDKFLKAIDTERMNPANTPAKEAPLVLGRQIPDSEYEKTNVRLLQATGLLISMMWLGGAALYVQRTVGWSNVSSLMPHELGGFLAGILAPVALFWMMAAFIMRSYDVKMYAEALREEIQAMIFPSEEADRKVNNDIERLMRQTSELSKATKHILGAIASARDGLRGEIKALDNSSEQTLDRLSRLSDSIKDRTGETMAIGQRLEEAFRQIESRGKITGDIMLRMDKTSQQMTAQNENLQKISQTTEETVDRLSKLLRERLESLSNIHIETEEALQNATEEMAKQRQLFRVEAQAVEQKASLVSSALQKGVGKIYEMTDDALDKAKLIETRLEGKAASLEQILAAAVQGAAVIEEKTGTAATQLGNAAQTAVSETQRLENILKEAVERLSGRAEFVVHQAQESLSEASNKLVSDIDGVSERAKTISAEMLAEVNRKVADTSAAFVYIQKQIQTLVSLFDERKQHLDEAGTGARETAESLQKSLQTALDKVKSTTHGLQETLSGMGKTIEQPIALIENATAKVERKAADVGEMLQIRAGTLVQAAEKIGDNVVGLHDQLHNKGQEVALIAGKIAGHLQSVTHELGNQNTLLDTQTKRSVDNLQNLAGMQRALTEEMQKLSSQAEVTKSHVQNLRESHVALSDDAAKSDTRLAQVSDRLIAISGSTVDKIKTTLENMTLLEADYHRLSESGIEHIQSVEKAYRATLDNTKNAATQIANDVSALQGKIETGTQATQESVQQQLEKIGAMVNTMQDASQTIQHSADATMAKMSRVQDFGQGVQVTMQQIGQAAQDFDARVAKSGQYIVAHVDALSDKAKKFEDITRNAVSAVLEQGDNLEQKTKEHVANLERSYDYASSFTAKLREYLGQLKGDTEGVEKALSTSVNNLLTHGQQIDLSTTRLIDKINQAHHDLLQQQHGVQHLGDDLMGRLSQATQHMSDKASALEQAAQLAQKQAEALREQEARLKREAFFNSTKFVVESLHSLALDFTRLLDGELPDRNWKSYQKGDAGSFTRRLLSARDETTQAKIKTKYKDDVEFRTYVQRYLRQFEEIYDQAAGNDHADLLASVFLSSDVGKLYQFLCTVLDRESRGSAVVAKIAA